MPNFSNHTANISHFPWAARLICLLLMLWFNTSIMAAVSPEDYDEDQIEIVEGEDRLIYEYRQNGILTMIKVVPKKGLSYYMVPADGAPHYESLDHKRKLYPQWIIKEW